jgi:hypothetical protein
MSLVTGFALGDIADENIAWFGEYDDDTKSDHADDDKGTAAREDI